jgi:hypothetical protein
MPPAAGNGLGSKLRSKNSIRGAVAWTTAPLGHPSREPAPCTPSEKSNYAPTAALCADSGSFSYWGLGPAAPAGARAEPLYAEPDGEAAPLAGMRGSR